MENKIKPILHVKLGELVPSRQELEQMRESLVQLTEGQYFVLLTAFGDPANPVVEILSPYKENGEVPQEVLDWMKTQVDGTEAGL